MFNKDNYVIYMTKQNRVLLYNKYTKKIIALANDQYQLLQKYTEGTATPDSATMNFWSSCGLLLDYSSNEGSRGAMSIYELDRKFHPNIFLKY